MFLLLQLPLCLEIPKKFLNLGIKEGERGHISWVNGLVIFHKASMFMEPFTEKILPALQKPIGGGEGYLKKIFF